MSRPSRTVQLVRDAMLLMSCVMAPAVAQAQIAQESLIIKDREPAEPNLIFTLDDSGSMAFNYLPDPNPDVMFRGHGREHEHIFAYHPGEPKGKATRQATRENYGVYMVEGLAGTDDRHLLGMRQRSAQVNGLYYDPDTRYRPWMDENGKEMPDADPKAVIYHVNHSLPQFANLKLDITGVHPVGQYGVCTRPRGPITDYADLSRQQVPCTTDASITTVMPATYYVLKRGADGNLLSDDNPAHFTRVSIHEGTTFRRPGTRTDCLKPGQKDLTTVECTQAQEYKNFANWFQYHRTRMHVAIAAVGRAFAEAVDGNVRVGYGRINKSERTAVDGVQTQVLEQGVRRFEGADRAAFLRWLNHQVGWGGTPLMRAMKAVGTYYERDDDQGPWSWQPGRGDGRAHLSCRRSFHILMTDGQYNFGTAHGERQQDFDIEADNDVGPVIEGPGGKRYQYRPVAPYRAAVRGSLADYAMHYWRRDLRPDVPNEVKPHTHAPEGVDNESFWQNVTTYTIGFGVEGTIRQSEWPQLRSGARQWPDRVINGSPQAVDDLWHAGVNGRGGYLDIRNSTSFLSELQGILVRIKGNPGSVGGVTVPSRSLSAGNQKFVPSFRTSKWYGNLKSHALDVNGTQGAEQWSAVKQLPVPANRRMFVGNGASSGDRAVPLAWNADLPTGVRQLLMQGAGLSEGHTAGRHNGLWLVDFLRGDRAQNGKLFRELPIDDVEFTYDASNPSAAQAAHIGYLGHIVNSPPTYIGAPTDHGYRYLPATFPGNKASGADSYARHVRAKTADRITWGPDGKAPRCTPAGQGRRPGLVFVGSNDGFLHAFDAACGVERFAWAPHAVLRELGRSSRKDYQPRYLMDGPLVEGDAFLNGAWANVLVGSTGAGPAALFALNVTDTRANAAGLGARSVMWELDAAHDADLGHVLQQPEIGVLADGRWVVVTGNGYESRSKRAKLLVVELETGRVLARLDTRAGSDGRPNGLGGVRLIRDGNQVITGAYAGDLHGNLWKFDLASTQVNEWKIGYGGRPMFRTDAQRPIVVAPATVTHPLGGQMVLFGTGKLFEVGDNRRPAKGQAPVEGIYGLWDNGRLEVASDGARRWRDTRAIEASQVQQRHVRLSADGRHATLPPGHADNQPLNWKTHRGWRIDQTMIPGGGQRSIVPAQLVSGLALFETMSPLVDERSLPCLDEVNTPAFNLLVDPLSGRMATKSLIDTDGNRVVNDRDQVVAGWSVADWTGRSVVLSSPPPVPCSGQGCTQVAQPTTCPPDSLMSNLQSVKRSDSVCVSVPTPSRWWWRELSIPDKSYDAGKAANTDEGTPP
ncbi:MAG: PilC/PilY family type IV pilus protein [Lautropia sp.]|nr:PilC/PilY family type IV pilus protein [Lautropia sp.]